MQIFPLSPDTLDENSSRPVLMLPTIQSGVKVANLTSAQEYRNKTSIRIYDENSKTYKNYSICSTPESVFGLYGIGLELYFYFIRQMTILFFLISLISIYPMYFNYTGHEFGSTNQNERYTYLTLANQEGINLYETDLEYARSQLGKIKSNLNKIWAVDLGTAILFLLFICYYIVSSKTKVQKALGEHYRISDFAIQVQGFPPFVTKDLIMNHFSSYGDIEEIYMSRNYEGKLPAYKKIYELAYEIEFESITTNHRITSKRLTLTQDIKDDKIGLNKTHDELPVDKVFVVFDKLISKKECLNHHKNVLIGYRCCKKRRNGIQSRRIARFPLNIQSAPNPSDIIWENMEFSYFHIAKRRIAVFLITALIILISFIVIYSLKSYFKNAFIDSSCKLENISGNLSVSKAKDLYKKELEVTCYCKQQSINSILFNNDYSSFCSEYIKSISKDSFLRLSISIFIVFINFVLKIIIQYLSKFEKFKSKSIKRKALFKKMFILSFVNTALTTLLSSMRISDELTGLKGKYEDLNRQWYDDVGSTIQVTMIVSIFSPHAFQVLILWPINVLKRKICIKRCRSQLKLNKLFKGPNFDISESLSQVLVVIFTNFFYSSGIPFLNIVCFFTLLLTYICSKVLMLRYHRAPPEYNHEINESIFVYLPFAIIFHCIFSIYAYGASEIFPNHVSKPKGSDFVEFETVTIGERISRSSGLSSMLLIALSLLLIFYIKFKQTDFFERFWRYKAYSDKDVEKISFRELKETNKLEGINTYDIYQHHKYKHLIKALDSVAKKRKELGYDKIYGDENRSESGSISLFPSLYLSSEIDPLNPKSLEHFPNFMNKSHTITLKKTERSNDRGITYTV